MNCLVGGLRAFGANPPYALGPGQTFGVPNIFPQMAGWLPEEEGAQLKFEFDTEMARLKAA